MYKVGDLVMLKSGGAQMVVVNIDVRGWCECIWHNEQSPNHWHNQGAVYPPAALQMAGAPTGKGVP